MRKPYFGRNLSKIRSRSSKSNQLFSRLPTMYLCKIGQNPFTGSKDNAQKLSYTNAGTHVYGIHNKPICFPLGLGMGDININLLIYVNSKSVHMANLLISLFMKYNSLEVNYFCITSIGGANILLLSPVHSRSIHTHVSQCVNMTP